MPGTDQTRLDAAGPTSTRGRLKVFLGYASGVGRSFRMFDEARRRKERGQDVVVGALQPQVPPEVDFTADNPGLTLVHCHQQLHMDFGFMTLFDYV